MTRLLCVRHGETAWNRESRVQGWAATGLTDRGEQQAQALGEWLDATHDVDRAVASDLQRTRETAALVRSAAAEIPEPAHEPTLRERGFGIYQGFLAEEVDARFPDHPEGKSLLTLRADLLTGESYETFVERVETGWDRLLTGATDGETVLVVTHGGVLKLVRGLLTDGDLTASLSQDSPPNCSVTEVTVEGGDAQLVRYGATPWADE